MRLVLLPLLLGACAAGAAAPPVTVAVPPAPIVWRSVLVAGDASLPVWDNAVGRLGAGLGRAGLPAPVTLSAATDTPAARVATRKNVTQAIEALRPGPGEGCLIFATAHGAPGRGLVLTRDRDTLDAATLDAAVERGCGTAPTVVVASGCFTGDFAVTLARPHRAVLTAARADRPSFGCGAGFRYTVFDECLITELEAGAGRWAEVVQATRRCVTRREVQAGVPAPSEPQSRIGRNVQGLPSPLAPRPRAG